MASNIDPRDVSVMLSREEAAALRQISKDAISQVTRDGLDFDKVSSTIVVN